ncbi:cuticle protein 16.8-like [Macrobrachium nipponense]|uniref:cuticle protein 16.8-like n=1 Tax=Macrobrachium nipponense TaxID=159736 RepID=UPI0030C7E53A
MKITLFVLLTLGTVALARPDSIFDFDLDDIHQDQDIDDNRVITGSYSWIAPDGVKYFVRYVADDDGYRVLESNAVPATVLGIRANGQQGSFLSSEEFDD